jgi:hypothetical protein
VAIIQSGATADLLTIDPTSKAGRVTLYDPTGALIGTSANPLRTQQGNGRTFLGQYSASTFRTLGTAATPQNLATFFVPAGLTKAAVKQVTLQFDTTAVLTSVSPSIKTSRLTAAPTGGSSISNVKMDSLNPNAVMTILGGTASDGGAATAITATAGTTLWTQFVDRLFTAVGQVAHEQYELIPEYTVTEEPLTLAGGEGLLVQAVIANAITSFFVVNVLWEEFTV